MTLAILGTGGHAKSIFDIVKNQKNIYFFDKEINLFNVGNKKFRVKRESKLLNSHIKEITKVIIAIGNNKIRKKKFDILKKLNYKIVTLIHPKSHIGYGSTTLRPVVIGRLARVSETSDSLRVWPARVSISLVRVHS